MMLAQRVEQGVNKRARIRRRANPRVVTVVGSRTIDQDEAEIIRLELSRSFRERQEREAQLRALSRRPEKGDAESMRFAMRCIEYRIVRGLWVLETSQASDGPRRQAKHGLDYMREGADHYAAGQWQNEELRPAVPSPKEISAAHEAIKWIEFLEDGHARLFRVAALTKRGERNARINWGKVKDRLRLPDRTPLRTLRERYDAALRAIVAELSLKSLGA